MTLKDLENKTIKENPLWIPCLSLSSLTINHKDLGTGSLLKYDPRKQERGSENSLQKKKQHNEYIMKVVDFKQQEVDSFNKYPESQGFPSGSTVKNLLAMQEAQEMQVQSLG